ncbi:hypothetical protein V1512DRAFT_246727 [Lipomyces arxii]|uniref:uncharacterized protein n=1 Tax=Lipomyces arxii TaxID=56418 RepID=UPI0034CDDC93
MAETTTEQPPKFEYKSISSSFEPPAAAVAPEVIPAAAKPAAEPAPVEKPVSEISKPAPEVAETAEQKSERIIGELKKSAARIKRFGGDTTEIDKIIARAEKFGPDENAVATVLKGLDKPLVERRRSGARDKAQPYQNRRQRNGQAKDTTTVQKKEPEFSETDKEKMRKRGERFAGK